MKIFANFIILFAVVTMFAVIDNSQKADRYKPEKINYRLPDVVRPTHYNIKLTSNFSIFDGEICIDLEVWKSTFDITLHCKQIVIDETMTVLTNSKNERLCPIEQNYIYEKEFFIVRFTNALQPDCYKLHFKFTGFIDNDTHGFNRRFCTDERQGSCMRYAVTNFKTTFARYLFPCFDEPDMKATFSISIKHQALYRVLSNMPIEEQSLIDEEGNVWTRFQKTPIMSTYLLGIVLLPHDSTRISNHDGTVNVWCRKNWSEVAKLIHEVTEKTKVQLENYTGIIKPIPKIDHVLISNHSSKSSENWGLIIYNEDDITYVEDPSDTYNVETVTRLVTHDLVHQWFGNLVGPSWWDHLWLNEAFAQYFQYYFVDKIYQDWRVLDIFVVAVQQACALSGDFYSFVQHKKSFKSIYQEPYLGFHAIACRKGSCILRMLSHCLSEKIFQKGIVTYLNTFQYDTSTPDRLWKIFEETMNPKKIDIKEMMDTWIKQKGYPLVTAKRDCNTGVIIITQERFKQSNSDDEEDSEIDDYDDENDDDAKWWIPINYTSRSEANYSSTLPTHWLKPQDENLTIDNVNANDWFILNVQQTGYYRVNYDKDNWKKIAEYLDSENYTKIHSLNRAQIIDDSCYMVRTKRLDPIIFLEITKYLSRETDYIPWYSAFRAFRTFQDYFTFPNSAVFLKPYALELIDGLLRNVGYDEHPNDDHLTKLKRVEVLELASDLEHLECRKIANAKLIAYIEDPDSNPIPSNLNTWVFTTGMKEADEVLFNKFLERYKSNPCFPTLRYLSGIEDPVLVEKLLKLTLTDDSPILKDDRVEVYRSLMYASVKNVNTTIDFITDNWKRISARIEDADEILDDVVGEITSWDQFHKVKLFIKANELNGKRSIDDVETILKKAEKHVSDIFRWMKTQNSLQNIDEKLENLHFTDVQNK
ncbi:aminopeptidase N-like isoform X1 [Vespula squamosa]|uniref:Aminopeptidase n=1 Tax=Vespula squamosa TaxID=30214 RepID=A0ABD2A9M8_VESSQ